MKNLIEKMHLKKREVNIGDFLHQPAQAAHFHILIEKSTLIKLEGNKTLLYLNLEDEAFDVLIPLLQRLKLNKSNRKSLGNNNYSILAGGIPARTNHSPICGQGSLNKKNDLLNNAIVNNLSSYLNDIFKDHLPEWHKVGQHFFKKINIHSDYQMADSFWTSAIVNRNSEHNYHFDSSNLKNTLSAMLTLKHQVSGGFLVLPEYGIALKTANRSLTFFYGKEILHGVSPIAYNAEDAFRYSIVLYTIEELKKCDSLPNEIKKTLHGKN